MYMKLFIYELRMCMKVIHDHYSEIHCLFLEIHYHDHLSLSYNYIRSSYMNHFIYITSVRKLLTAR